MTRTHLAIMLVVALTAGGFACYAASHHSLLTGGLVALAFLGIQLAAASSPQKEQNP